MSHAICPDCKGQASFSQKRKKYFCADCETWFVTTETDERGPPKTAIRVFLSYGHDVASTELVERIRQDLERQGISVWIDADRIRFGDDWRQSITEGIQASTHVLAFLSRHSTRKPGVCRQEIAIALGPGKAHVYTVLVEPETEVSPPLLISHLQWLDMQEWQKLRAAGESQFEVWYQGKLSDILAVLRSSEPFAGEITELEEWLRPSDCVADMVLAEAGFIGRDWLIGRIARAEASRHESEFADQPGGEIEAWRTDPTAGRVFWITGGPGTGKSAIAARLAHSGRARVMAVHFCRHDRPDRRDAARAVRSIAFQMATRLGDYRAILVDLQRRGEDLDGLSALELFDLLIANPLRHELGGGRSAGDKHVIVLDALDETLDANGRSDLLYLVSQEASKLPEWVGLVVTSRPEPAIKRKLKAHGLHEIRADDPRNLSDLKLYAQRWLSGLKLQGRRPAKALRSVLDAAAGNFLYLRQLEESVARRVIAADALSERHLLPAGLPGLYSYWFERRFLDAEAYRTQLRPLFELMLASYEPLPLALAAHVLAWDDYQQLAILDQMGSLLFAEQDVLVFFHKSLHDWVGDADVAGSRWFASESSGHARLARSLLGLRDTVEILSAPVRSYLLRHLPQHLARAGMNLDFERVLSDFVWAMRRVDGGALEQMLADYRPIRGVQGTLQAWADCILCSAHLLRRATPQWPASRILLQVAIEHADDSSITEAAQLWLDLGACDWTWVRLIERPPRFSPSPILCILEGHRSEVRGAKALGPDRVLSWSEDGTLRIWDGVDGLCESVFEADERAGIESAGPLGNEAVWAISEEGARIWLIDAEICVAYIAGRFGPVVRGMLEESAGLVDPDLAMLLARACETEERLAATHDAPILGMLRIDEWSLLTWSCEEVLRSPLSGNAVGWRFSEVTGMIQGVSVLQSERIACWVSDGSIALIDGVSGAMVQECRGHGRGVLGVVPLGAHGFVSWGSDRTLRIWETDTGSARAVLEGHEDTVSGVEVIDATEIISWSSDGTVRCWTQEAAGVGYSSRILATQIGWGGVSAVKLLSEGGLMIFGAEGLQFYDQITGNHFFRELDDIKGLTILDENQRMVSWASTTLQICDPPQSLRALGPSLQSDAAWTIDAALTSDGTLVRLRSDGDLIFGQDEPVRPGSRPCGLLPLPDAHMLSWHTDGSLLVWESGARVQKSLGDGHLGVDSVITIDSDHVLSQVAVAYHAVGTRNAVADRAVIWNWRTGARVGDFDQRVERALPDPNCVLPLHWAFLGAHLNGLVIISKQGEHVSQLLGELTANVDGGMLLAGGRVVSWSDDGSLMLWDAATGTRLRHLCRHIGQVLGGRMLPDGRLASWARWDSRVLIWDLDDDLSGPIVLEGHHSHEDEGGPFIGVTGTALTADGDLLSWTPTETILWDLESNEPAMTYTAPGTRGAWADTRGEVYTWGNTRFRSWGLTEDDEVRITASDPAVIPEVAGLLEVLQGYMSQDSSWGTPTKDMHGVGDWLLRAYDTRLSLRDFRLGTTVTWHAPLLRGLRIESIVGDKVILRRGGKMRTLDKHLRVVVVALMRGNSPALFTGEFQDVPSRPS